MKNLLSFPPSFEAFYSEEKNKEVPVVDRYPCHFESLSPFFSIGLPTYNREAMLSKAIDSVLQQTFSNFELIVCDNNSSDNTLEVIKTYDDPRIRYVKYKTLVSMYDNHHRVIKFVRSKWLVFLHSDDYLYPNALKLYHDLILDKQTPDVSVYYPSYSTHQSLNWDSEKSTKNTYLFDNVSYLYRYHAGGPTGTVFEINEIKKFDTKETYFETSLDLLIKILKDGERMLIVNENIVQIGNQKERDTTYVTISGKLVDYLYRLLYSSLDKNVLEVIFKSINNWTSQEIVFLLNLIAYNNDLESINFIEEKLSPRFDYRKIKGYQNVVILKYLGYWGFQILYLVKRQLKNLKYQCFKLFIAS